MEVLENRDERSSGEERLRMRIAVLEESLRSCEVESRSSRLTVLRLVEELQQERRRSSSSSAALRSLTEELDGLVVSSRSVEMEKQTLGERLEASQRVTEAVRQESLCLDKQVEELQRQRQAAEGKLQELLEKMAALLQGPCQSVVPPTEEEVLRSLDGLCNKIVLEMEEKLHRVSEELTEQTELQLSSHQKTELAEQQVQDLKRSLQVLEARLQAAELQRDELQLGRRQDQVFVEQLCETMKVEKVAVELGVDMRLKLILSRAEQLVQQEAAALVQSRSLTYSLQRKLKSQKEQLQSKDLQVQLLRSKVTELQEEKTSRWAPTAAPGEAHLKVKRLQKKLERLQGELKAGQLKLTVTQQKKQSAANSDLQNQDKRTREDRQQLEGLRQSLAQLSQSHRDLLNFRALVSQMLGLDPLAVERLNSDILELLEALLHAHHHHHHHHHVLHQAEPWSCSTLHQPPQQLQGSCSSGPQDPGSLQGRLSRLS